VCLYSSLHTGCVLRSIASLHELCGLHDLCILWALLCRLMQGGSLRGNVSWPGRRGVTDTMFAGRGTVQDSFYVLVRTKCSRAALTSYPEPVYGLRASADGVAIKSVLLWSLGCLPNFCLFVGSVGFTGLVFEKKS
jgi:hypothetical protein